MNPRFQGARNSQNNNNKILIGVSVFSIILIVFAIFLLNSTFSNSNRNNSASNNSLSSVSSSSRRTGSGFADTTTPASASSRRSASNSPASNSGSSSTGSGEYSLENNQLVARYLGDGEPRNFEIVECKVEQVYFCKPGVKLTYQDGQAREAGKLYKMSGQIDDRPDGMSLSGMSVTDL